LEVSAAEMLLMYSVMQSLVRLSIAFFSVVIAGNGHFDRQHALEVQIVLAM
jgi:hypothetical protein